MVTIGGQAMKFILIYFSIPLILYILTCIKHKTIAKIELKQGLIAILFAPFLILYLVWEEL